VTSDTPGAPGSDDKERQTPEGEIAERVERQIVERLGRHLPDKPIDSPEFAQALAKVFAVEIREIMVSFSGPLPPPKMLKEYETALPGLGERIVARADKEQAFRHEIAREHVTLTKKRQHHGIIRAYVGQAGAFVIAMTAVGGGIGLLAAGMSAAGLGSIIAALVALVAVFLGVKITDALRKRNGSDGNGSDDAADA
jgi:uncharacterized membrane protein